MMTKQDDLKIIKPKVVLVGNPSSDKTSIILRATSDDFDSENPRTISSSNFTKRVKLADAIVDLQIWDTAGQEQFKALNPLYYRNSIVSIVVFSLTESNSLVEARQWIIDLKKELNEMPILFLVGSKCDMTDERVIVYDDCLQLAKEFNALYYEVSAKTGRCIEDLFLNVALESAKKLSNEILVLSSIKCNLNDNIFSSLRIENPNLFLTFSIKNNPHVVKCSGLIKDSLNLAWNDPVSFCIFDKKPDVLMINICHKSENGESIEIGKIDFPISNSKKSMIFENNIYSKKDAFSKIEIAFISFKLDRTNYRV